jgi:hypothetical protein
LNLKSTWGDRHYIGLNGIEIFSSEGYPVMIRKVRNHNFPKYSLEEKKTNPHFQFIDRSRSSRYKYFT